jgi:hypothetical protein
VPFGAWDYDFDQSTPFWLLLGALGLIDLGASIAAESRERAARAG